MPKINTPLIKQVNAKQGTPDNHLLLQKVIEEALHGDRRLFEAPADPTAAPHVPRRSRAVRFGGSATAVLFGKELKLLGRDPELIS